MSEEKPAIRVKGLSKTFRLPHERHSELRQRIANIGRGEKGYEVQQVLDDVSFEIKKGEFFGIVGKNGSGKSTLLKTIAGIYAPDKGKVTVNGKLVPFIELGVGFNPDLTGRENVFLNGALLGFSRKEMNAMYDEIVEFAELERFMDQKLKNYSSGMQVRLAFSIAIRAQGDVLLLDEVLAVGDSAFQQKCFEYFAQLRRENKTVILVTHSMDSVERFCARALMLSEGKIQVLGDTGDVARAYEEANRKAIKKAHASSRGIEETIGYSDEVKVGLEIVNQDGAAIGVFTPDDRLVFIAKITSTRDIEDAFMSLTIKRADGQPMYNITTEGHNPHLPKLEKDKSIYVKLELQNIFSRDSYSVNILIKSTDRTREYFTHYRAISFKVSSNDRQAWSLHPIYHMQIADVRPEEASEAIG